ncbi:MAG TPA: SRPBCC domain-containing protein [Thermoanaerobaculia bacterium]|nr:SRPBCC domain-containing protein [Thermoanaerobaculia bacterium]
MLSVFGFAGKLGAMTGDSQAPKRNEIARDNESIHQEVVIKASRARVYAALTDAKQFSKVTDHSMPGVATVISPEAGGEFSLFGGHIIGRHIEMVPNERLVQAWREKGWDPGIYSIAVFRLNDGGAVTNLVFDHTGFPNGAAEHLAAGWKSHYWEGLQKYLA